MAGKLKPLITTCEPRADVMAGGLSDNHFAAQLDQVVRSPEKYPIYGDPSEFFAVHGATQRRIPADVLGVGASAEAE